MTLRVWNDGINRFAGLLVRTGGHAAIALLGGISAFLLVTIQPLLTDVLLPYTNGQPFLWHVLQVFFLTLLTGGFWFARITKPSSLAVLYGIAALSCLVPWGVTSIHPDSVWRAMLWPAPATALVLFCLGTIIVVAQRLISPMLGKNSLSGLYVGAYIGSVLAVFSYIYYIDPRLDLRRQLGLWRIAAACLLLLMAYAGRFAANQQDERNAVYSRVSTDVRKRWLTSGFWAIGLMLAFTTFLVNVYGSHPGVWLAPVCLYVATLPLCVMASSFPWLRLLGHVSPAAALLAVGLCVFIRPVSHEVALLHLACVGVLVAGVNATVSNQPDASDLGARFLYMGIGGVLAALSAALLLISFATNAIPETLMPLVEPVFGMAAPEYVVFLLGTALAITRRKTKDVAGHALLARYVEPVIWGLILVGGLKQFTGSKAPAEWAPVAVAVSLCITVPFLKSGRQLIILACVIFLANAFQQKPATKMIYWSRSYLGQMLVSETGSQRLLNAGSVVQGNQPVDCARALLTLSCVEATSYYSQSGPREALGSILLQRS